MQQLNFMGVTKTSLPENLSYRERLEALLDSDLDFHNYASNKLTHTLHPFPAKFPPQLPKYFINELTKPGEVVFDPMAGSGTTLLEALYAQRKAIGTDIDPLALTLCRTKTTPLPLRTVGRIGQQVQMDAYELYQNHQDGIKKSLEDFDPKTQSFLDYWFLPETQEELLALYTTIQQVETANIRRFLEVTFSGTIIAKSGGVSLARDLAHTRPHRVDTKMIPSAFELFASRLSKNIKSIATLPPHIQQAKVIYANAQELSLRENSVDLIVTSPPYASNAIDYMRAHKFTLVWWDYPIKALSERRKTYIGGEAQDPRGEETFPANTQDIVREVTEQSESKGRALVRYYSEMTRVFKNLLRVLKPGKAAIIVVGSSVMRGIDTQTHYCLSEIGNSIGFETAGIGIRKLDRNRRMMPARWGKKRKSQIEERMHEEYIIGFYKPEGK